MEYGLIGERLGHSFSKEIHARIADYPYELVELERDDIAPFLRQKNFRAINVTIPYKETVMPYLDFISEDARKIGAVNTIVNRGGKLYGYNTDYYGAEMLIRSAALVPAGKKVLVLGTGGTCKTLSAVLADMGAREVLRVSRRASADAITYEDAYAHHTDAEIVVNTTPVGMYPHGEACPIDLSCFPRLEGVVDVIYNPLKTRFVQTAEAMGKRAVGGLLMLAAQAVYASALFRGIPRDDSLCERVCREVLREKQSIVLIGMPASGKSTVGRLLAARTGRALVDTDEEIVKSSRMSIPDIFAREGEDAFRDREAATVASLAATGGRVIATGGGAILRAENLAALRANGILYFLDRPLGDLTPTGDRPLSRDREALACRYRERYPLYLAAADVRIAVTGNAETVTDAILEDFNK